MNQIHETAIIGDDVEFGEDNIVGPFSVIIGPCILGDGNWIGPHAVIGTPVAIRGHIHTAGWANEPGPGSVRIGSGNVIREHVGIQRGSAGVASIGNDCYVMANVHVSHDADISDGVTLTCGTMLAGHVSIGEGSNLGMGTVVHQRIRIGRGIMAGMGSVISRDVPDYALLYGTPARVMGANRVGMERSGMSLDQIREVERRLTQKPDLDPNR